MPELVEVVTNSPRLIFMVTPASRPIAIRGVENAAREVLFGGRLADVNDLVARRLGYRSARVAVDEVKHPDAIGGVRRAAPACWW